MVNAVFGQSSGFGTKPVESKNPQAVGVTPFTMTPSTPQSGGSGLFGSSTAASSAPQSSAPIFGSSTPFGGPIGSTASQPQQSSASPFAAATTSQPQSSGPGIFGSSTPFGGTIGGSTAATSQPQQSSGGSFGQTTTSQPQTGTSGLFGSTTSASQPQQSGGGLFGQSTATSAPSGGGGGLFGASQQSSQPQQTSSLFGGNNAQQNQAKPNPFGGFGGLGGSTNNNQPQQASTSLFPQQSLQQPQQQNSLFGSSLRSGGLTMGQSTNQQQQQTVPGVKIDLSQIRGTTRFNDLHDDLQKQIEQIEGFIQQQIAFKEQCDALMPAHENTLSSIPSDVEYVQNQLETCELALDNDSSAVNDVKKIVQQEADNARLSFRAVENLKLPQQFHYSGVWNNINTPRAGVDDDAPPMDVLGFFDTTSSSLSSTLQKYQSNLAEIENHLGIVEANTAMQAQQLMFKRGREGGARSRDDQIAELASVLREFEGGILQVAESVGKVREDVVTTIEAGSGGMGNGWR